MQKNSRARRFLIYSEPDRVSIQKATLGLLERLDGQDVELVIIGQGEQTGLDLISAYRPRRIHRLTGASIKHYSPEGYSDALYGLIKAGCFDMVLAGASSKAQDIFPRLSVRFATNMLSGVKDFSFRADQVVGVKEIYGGSCLTDITILDTSPVFVTVKLGSLGFSGRDATHPIDIIQTAVQACPIHTRLDKVERTDTRPPLDSASIVVAGGRGLGNKKTMQLLEQLADILGAALGASGGAVGNHFAPQAYLIGQTGTYITPSLYIACGISGATHHLAGIRNAGHILSINTDEHAPLMRIADYAIVGDLKEVIPAITRQLIIQKNGGGPAR